MGDPSGAARRPSARGRVRGPPVAPPPVAGGRGPCERASFVDRALRCLAETLLRDPCATGVARAGVGPGHSLPLAGPGAQGCGLRAPGLRARRQLPALEVLGSGRPGPSPRVGGLGRCEPGAGNAPGVAGLRVGRCAAGERMEESQAQAPVRADVEEVLNLAAEAAVATVTAPEERP